jgi:hypothetical protein
MTRISTGTRGCVVLTVTACMLFSLLVFVFLVDARYSIHHKRSVAAFDPPGESQYDAVRDVAIMWPRLMSEPEDGYPSLSPLLGIIEGWNPDEAIPPKTFRESLQHFNYSNPFER